MCQTEGADNVACWAPQWESVLRRTQGMSTGLSEVNELRTEPMVENYLFLEQAEG
jgi:hypothetical protein